MGRSDAYASSYDLESETYVPLPKGDVHKKKELVQDVTLGDLDAANARPQGGQDIMSVMVLGDPEGLRPLPAILSCRADLWAKVKLLSFKVPLKRT